MAAEAAERPSCDDMIHPSHTIRWLKAVVAPVSVPFPNTNTMRVVARTRRLRGRGITAAHRSPLRCPAHRTDGACHSSTLAPQRSGASPLRAHRTDETVEDPSGLAHSHSRVSGSTMRQKRQLRPKGTNAGSGYPGTSHVHSAYLASYDPAGTTAADASHSSVPALLLKVFELQSENVMLLTTLAPHGFAHLVQAKTSFLPFFWISHP